MFFHVWFVTKYRKPVLDSKIEERLLAIIEEIVDRKGYRVLEIGPNKDHVHILLELDRKKELPGVVRTLKVVTAKKMLEETPHLRVGNARYYRRKRVGTTQRKVVGRHFWAKRYGFREIDENEIEGIREYIRNQKKIPHT